MLLENEYGHKDFAVATVLGNWVDHYKSWKNLKFAPLLIIKYEDLIIDTKKTFILILNFLSKLMDVKIDEKKIINSINSCSFDIMAKKEKVEGFPESVTHKKSNKKLNFFNLGEKNNWKTLLDKKLVRKIESRFKNEMSELGY